VHGVNLPQAQDFSLIFVELHEVPVSPFLQPSMVPLDVSTTFWNVSHSSQFCITYKLAEDALCPSIQVIKTLNSTDLGYQSGDH